MKVDTALLGQYYNTIHPHFGCSYAILTVGAACVQKPPTLPQRIAFGRLSTAYFANFPIFLPAKFKADFQ